MAEQPPRKDMNLALLLMLLREKWQLHALDIAADSISTRDNIYSGSMEKLIMLLPPYTIVAYIEILPCVCVNKYRMQK